MRPPAISLIPFPLQIFQEIADSGVKIIIAGSSVGELALHYLNRMGIAVLKVLSKFDLRRLCRVVNATPLARVGAPTAEEAGFVDVFECIEIGGDRVTVLRQIAEVDSDYVPSSSGDVRSEKTRTATVVLRGATQNRLDDLERAVDDGVNVIKALIKDPRLVAGAGATELELAKRVEAYGGGLKGLAQHAVKRWAQALEVVPRTLAENALGGAEGNEVVSRLYAKHEGAEGAVWGVDVEVRILLLSAVPAVLIKICVHSRRRRTVRCRRHSTKSLTRSRRSSGRSSSLRRQQRRCIAWTASS